MLHIVPIPYSGKCRKVVSLAQLLRRNFLMMRKQSRRLFYYERNIRVLILCMSCHIIIIIISYHISYRFIISYHIADVKRQNRLKVGTSKPKLKVKMQSVSAGKDSRVLEKPRFKLTAKGVFCIQTEKMLHPPEGRSTSLGQQPEPRS